jgi:hypothetical protein
MARLSLGVIVMVMLASSCGSSDKPPTGKTCMLNSDCNNPLSCSFGKCHETCKESRDCQPGQRCIKGPAGNVCQLDVEKSCPPSTACQTPLICAIDLQCRNNCTTAAECTPGQVCAGGACAETSEVGPDGKLKPAPDGGAGGGMDAGVDAPPMMGNGPCGVPESEPNDKRENATPLMVPAMFTGCIGAPDDIDFYELTTPDDGTGGYFQFSLTDIGNWAVDVTGYNVADNGEIAQLYAASDGQNLHGFLAAAPGFKYRLAVRGFINVGSAPTRYTMKVTYTKVADAYEPNNTRDTAKTITIGTPVMAYMFEGVKALPLKAEDVVDWYTVMAAAGNLTVTVESVPSDMTAFVHIFDPTGKEVYGYGPNDGANATVMVMNGPAGAYKIQVHPFGVRPALFFDKAATPMDLPSNFTTPYKLTVSQ